MKHRIHILLTLSYETLLLLVRDRVMIPVLIGSLLISIFANLASDWSVEDFTKILFDIGYFGFSLTGSLIAIFFGTKILTDSRLEGSVEVQLSAPVTRPMWLLGKFGGLKACLLLICLSFGMIWQFLMVLNHFGWMSIRQMLMFVFLYINWLVLASLAMLFASFSGQATATFSSLGLWLVGLTSAAISRTLSSETPPFTQTIVRFLARIWNLQEFNLLPLVLDSTPLANEEWVNLSLRGVYGITLVLIFLASASWIFSQRDLS